MRPQSFAILLLLAALLVGCTQTPPSSTPTPASSIQATPTASPQALSPTPTVYPSISPTMRSSVDAFASLVTKGSQNGETLKTTDEVDAELSKTADFKASLSSRGLSQGDAEAMAAFTDAYSDILTSKRFFVVARNHLATLDSEEFDCKNKESYELGAFNLNQSVYYGRSATIRLASLTSVEGIPFDVSYLEATYDGMEAGLVTVQEKMAEC